MTILPDDILRFWFIETKPEQWFQSNPDFDRTIAERFMDDYELAARGDRNDWMETAEGCLALCILLDQFPRNMFRGTPKAFATDGRALEIARYVQSKGFDKEIDPFKRRFLYLPFEHSENLDDQKTSVSLFAAMKNEDEVGYDYALRHLQVIETFSRFPHRNAILGRPSTPAEEEYLAQPGSGF